MRLRFLFISLAAAVAPIATAAQEAAEPHVVVRAADSGEEFEEPGGYGQPQWAERSRASATTKLYVLSPFEVFAGVLSESDFTRHENSVHDLTQEIEIGLPYRFEVSPRVAVLASVSLEFGGGESKTMPASTLR